MSNIVSFILNINGNANNVLANIGGTADKTTKSVNKLNDNLANLANIGFVIRHVAGAFKAVNSAVSKFTDAYKAQSVAETNLATAMRNTMNATDDEINSIKRLASEQQKLGVIGDEVQLAGAQELATYLEKSENLKKLIPVMNDMLAKENGLNATQGDAKNIAMMVGKVLDGQTGALSRVGYSFTDAEKKILEFGNEEQRVTALSDILTRYVGGANEALAATPEGKQKQIADNMGDINERVGSLIVRLKAGLNPIMELIINKTNRLIDLIEQKNIIPKLIDGFGKLTNFISEHARIIGVVAGAWFTYGAVVRAVSIYNAVAALTTTLFDKTLKNLQWRIFQAQYGLFSLSAFLKGFSISALMATVSARLLVPAINAISVAIYNIPIIGWIAAAIALLITVFKLLWDKCEGFRRLLFGIWEATKAVFHNIWVVIKAIGTTIWEVVKVIRDGITGVVGGVFRVVRNVVGSIFGVVRNVVGSIWGIIKSVANGIWNVLKGIWDGIVSVAQSVWNIITSVAQSVWGFVVNLWNKIKNVFGAVGSWLYEHLIQPVKNAFSGLWDFIKGIFQKIWDKMLNLIKPIRDLWNKIFGSADYQSVSEAYAEGAEKGSESFRNSQKEKENSEIQVGDVGSGNTGPILELANRKKKNTLNDTLLEDADKVAAGGGKQTNITVNLNKEMVGQISIHSAHLSEGLSEMKTMIKETLAEILNSANAVNLSN
jgi:hypothetical protein